MTILIKHFDDIGFSVVAEHREIWLYVEFKVYEQAGIGSDGTHYFSIEEDNGESLREDKIEDADVFLNGSVKWDGCSNWMFDEQERGWIHACSRDDLVNMGEVMARCRDLAATLLPSWCGG